MLENINKKEAIRQIKKEIKVIALYNKEFKIKNRQYMSERDKLLYKVAFLKNINGLSEEDNIEFQKVIKQCTYRTYDGTILDTSSLVNRSTQIPLIKKLFEESKVEFDKNKELKIYNLTCSLDKGLTLLHIVYNRLRNAKPHTEVDDAHILLIGNYHYKKILERIEKEFKVQESQEATNAAP